MLPWNYIIILSRFKIPSTLLHKCMQELGLAVKNIICTDADQRIRYERYKSFIAIYYRRECQSMGNFCHFCDAMFPGDKVQYDDSWKPGMVQIHSATRCLFGKRWKKYINHQVASWPVHCLIQPGDANVQGRITSLKQVV